MYVTFFTLNNFNIIQTQFKPCFEMTIKIDVFIRELSNLCIVIFEYLHFSSFVMHYSFVLTSKISESKVDKANDCAFNLSLYDIWISLLTKKRF